MSSGNQSKVVFIPKVLTGVSIDGVGQLGPCKGLWLITWGDFWLEVSDRKEETVLAFGRAVGVGVGS